MPTCCSLPCAALMMRGNRHPPYRVRDIEQQTMRRSSEDAAHLVSCLPPCLVMYHESTR